MRFPKYLFTILLSFFILLILSQTVFAVDIVKREDIGMDETLSVQMDIYSLPQKIYISQLEGYNKEFLGKPNEWIKALYYYSVTRLGLNDIPYNYLIDKSGNIYEGARGGEGINPGLEGGQNVVLIGIMDNNTTLAPRTSEALNSLVQELSYKYGIKNTNWEFVELKLKKSSDKVSYMTYSVSTGELRSSIVSSLAEVQWSDSEHLKYKGSIVSVDYAKEVEVGNRLDVKVKIKNENDFIWFGDLSYIYVSTVDSKETPHAINMEWESFSKPTHLQNVNVKPGETVEVTFQMEAKSKPGEYKESFYFMKSADNIIEGSNFDVEFTITRGNNKLIQLTSPEFGYVNIRECRWYSCKVLEVADEGWVYAIIKKEEGWYQIKFGKDQTGWVYQKYAKEI